MQAVQFGSLTEKEFVTLVSERFASLGFMEEDAGALFPTQDQPTEEIHENGNGVRNVWVRPVRLVFASCLSSKTGHIRKCPIYLMLTRQVTLSRHQWLWRQGLN